MTEEKKERILEAACDICHWPYTYRDDETMKAEKCDFCPVEAAVMEAKRSEEETLCQVIRITAQELNKLPEAIAKGITAWKRAQET